MLPRKPFVLVWALAAGCFFPAVAAAQMKKSDAKVKIEPSAGPIDKDGRQVVSVKLTVETDWHLTANPAGNQTHEASKVVLQVAGQKPLQDVQIAYPPGKEKKDPNDETFLAYEGTVVLRATVQRAPGDTGPLELTLALQVCDKESKCMAPAKVKRTVP